MMTTYPSCITDSQLCNSCYASQSCTNCKDDNSPPSCSDYCNSGCNTTCKSAQTFCSNGVQKIVNHADVPSFMSGCWAKDQIIYNNWKATDWNNVLKALSKAASLGKERSQGSLPSYTSASSNGVVTAEIYNSMVDCINFFNKSISKVNVNDVIRASHALALETGYNSATFNSSVCDVCNAGNENRNDCNCDCDCDCDCSCGCSCDCDCPCTCPGCSCSCSNPCLYHEELCKGDRLGCQRYHHLLGYVSRFVHS